MRIRTLSVASLVLAAVAVVSGVAIAQNNNAGTSTLKGIVRNSAGTPMPSVSVRLFVEQGPITSGGAQQGGAGGKSIGFTPAPNDLMKGVMIRSVVTDANGNFEAKGLKAGGYTYRAGDPSTIGYKYGTTTLEDNKVTEIEIKLDPPARR